MPQDGGHGLEDSRSHSRGAFAEVCEEGDDIKLLEDALKGCKKAVVYLEQARDIYLRDTEGTALCEDLIKRYIFVRRKIFNLSKAWQRFKAEKK